MQLVYTLSPKCDTRVPDAAGLWEFEGGELLLNDRRVGYFHSSRRTSCGTTALETAATWTTLFFEGNGPRHNMTLHGASQHNYRDVWQVRKRERGDRDVSNPIREKEYP